MTPESAAHRLVLVTGPAGAGRITAIRALEDMGFEAIDNMPLSLTAALVDRAPTGRPTALGIDARNRDFSTDGVADVIDRLSNRPDTALEVVYLDCAPDTLLRRFSETRRRHPLSPAEPVAEGISRDADLLAPIRDRADILIDTSELSPHDLRREMSRWFGSRGGHGLAITLQSFSYRRGVPRGVDTVFDVRFLRNPHWVDELRPLDGRDRKVADHIGTDPRFQGFFEQLSALVFTLLPAYLDEGKAHLSIGFGCTGGRHRSVMMAEALAIRLADAGWRVSKRHRELERHGTGPSGQVETTA